MKTLISLFLILSTFSVQADFENKRMKYSDAELGNQFELAIRVIGYRIPLNNITPIKESSQYGNLGDFFKGEITKHHEYQKTNQDVLATQKSTMTPIEADVSTEPPAVVTPKFEKDLAKYFTCLNDQLVNLKRKTYLAKQTTLAYFEKEELDILKSYLDQTRARSGERDYTASLCSKFLGNASFDQLSDINAIKYIYALKKLNDDAKKQLLIVQVAANHMNASIKLKDVWLFSSKFLVLKAFTNKQSLPDRDTLIATIIQMREKLRPADDVTVIGKGSETKHYILKDIKADMEETYDQAEELVNDIE